MVIYYYGNQSNLSSILESKLKNHETSLIFCSLDEKIKQESTILVDVATVDQNQWASIQKYAVNTKSKIFFIDSAYFQPRPNILGFKSNNASGILYYKPCSIRLNLFDYSFGRPVINQIKVVERNNNGSILSLEEAEELFRKDIKKTMQKLEMSEDSAKQIAIYDAKFRYLNIIEEISCSTQVNLTERYANSILRNLGLHLSVFNDEHPIQGKENYKVKMHYIDRNQIEKHASQGGNLKEFFESIIPSIFDLYKESFSDFLIKIGIQLDNDHFRANRLKGYDYLISIEEEGNEFSKDSLKGVLYFSRYAYNPYENGSSTDGSILIGSIYTGQGAIFEKTHVVNMLYQSMLAFNALNNSPLGYNISVLVKNEAEHVKQLLEDYNFNLIPLNFNKPCYDIPVRLVDHLFAIEKIRGKMDDEHLLYSGKVQENEHNWLFDLSMWAPYTPIYSYPECQV